jgi:hypothetical protein
MNLRRTVTLLLALSTILVWLCGTALASVEPSPWRTTTLHTEVVGEAQVTACGANDTVPLTGQLPVVSWVRMSATGTSVELYLDLHGVEGIGDIFGQRYLGLGVAQYSAQLQPGPPSVPTFTVHLRLQSVGVPPSPCITDPGMLPVGITLIFDETGALTEARAEVLGIGY